MENRLTIEEEISKHKQLLRNLEDVHPDYLSPELKELQASVLSVHAHLEAALEQRISQEIKNVLGPASGDELWIRLFPVVRPLLDRISYREKVGIVEAYNDGSPRLFEGLKRVNAYRNEFAHPEGMSIRSIYAPLSGSKVAVRDLLRCLADAQVEMEKYFSALTSQQLPKWLQHHTKT